MIDIKKFMHNFFCYIIAGIFIYDCRSMYSIAWHVGKLPNYILVVSISVCIFITLSEVNRDKLKKLAKSYIHWISYLFITTFFMYTFILLCLLAWFVLEIPSIDNLEEEFNIESN